MKGLRKLRIESFIKREIEIELEKMDDPHLKFLTVTRVEVSEDLRSAKIFIGYLQDEKEKDEMMLALTKAARPLQKVIATKVKMRYTPLISFQYDTGFLKGTKVLEILDKIKKETKNEE